MSIPLSTLGLSLPSSIHNRKTNTKFSVSNAWGSKCAPAAKKIDHHESMRLSLQPDYGSQSLKQLVTNCSRLSGEEDVSEEDDMRTKFAEMYSMLKSELLNDPAFEWTHDSRLWVEQMMDYNVTGGKLGRDNAVVNCYKLLKEGRELSEDELFDASVMGWCLEWLFSSGCIVDDILDSSHTRHGKPCWYRVPKVGKIAINDAVLLMSQFYRILKKHFRDRPFYADLLDLMNEMIYQTYCGQMLDVITSVVQRDLSNYTLQNYRRMAKHKSGYALCNLPECVLLIAGEDLNKHVYMKDVLLEMSLYLQIVNDYLDCFGNPEKTGKIGTDIEDFKFSWLIVKALELANEEQKKILHDHYGKSNPSDVAKVKAMYNEINIQEVFAVYERETCDKITTCIEAHPNKILQGYWASFEGYRQLLKYS